eukprot:167353_1
MSNSILRLGVMGVIFALLLPILIPLLPLMCIGFSAKLLKKMCSKKKVYSVEVGPERPDGGRPRRNIKSPDKLVLSVNPNGMTIHGEFRKSVEQFNDKACLGSRREVGKVRSEISVFRGDKEVRKVVDVPKKSDFEYMTYGEVGDIVTQFRNGLAHFGLKKGDSLGLFLDTCAMWQVCNYACLESGVVVVTVYATLGLDSLVHALNLTEVSAVFTSAALVSTLLEGDLPTVKLIVFTGEVDDDKLQHLRNRAGSEVAIIRLADLIKIGSEVYPNTVSLPDMQPSDVSTIMFTSGSTGMPKGVVITHRMVLAFCAGFNVTGDAEMIETDVYLAYLPLAHILEYCAEQLVIQLGLTIGYGSVRTLNDSGCFDENGNPKGDLRSLRPTIMCAVPLVLDRIRNGIETKVAASGTIKQTLFSAALMLKQSVPMLGCLADKIVFRAVTQATGGRLRGFLSGGAPLSGETQKFIETVFGAPVMQGYGATETCAGGTITHFHSTTTGTVGAPVASCEIRLRDCPEMGYTSEDKPYPRGEILIRGFSVASMYYKGSEEQQAAFESDPDGAGDWYASGDIGMWLPDGTLKIIDRKKDLVKLSHGEYIALSYLESVYKSCDFVENILVHANGMKLRPVALIIPNQKILFELAKKKNISGSLQEIVDNTAVVKDVMTSMNDVAKKSKLKPCEKMQNIKILSD